ncbi:MAG: hypothetical protein CVU69_08150 [Deltaproteobacteria bacterium HGW-Deltaproteobacteria-4]|nr:MAG: hypothetical protein CVU69_08150 [Deltaproteobacteria bacterium HGW-Deltaproteobacteria-4]
MKIDKDAVIAALDIPVLLKELKPDAKSAAKGKLIARCLNPERHNNGDANPSMLLFTDNGSFNCQACGLRGDIFDLYGHIHGMDFKDSLHSLAAKAGIETIPPIKCRVTEKFTYHDAKGNHAYTKERIEPSRDRRKAKEFIIKGPDGKPGQPCGPLLYRLPEIINAPAGSLVLITEGEKQADFLVSWGLLATTLPHGAGSSWDDSYTLPLAGKHIVILTDNDTPGKKYGETICSSMKNKAASLKIVELPDLPSKGDVIDWQSVFGNDREKLLKIVEDTSILPPESYGNSERSLGFVTSSVIPTLKTGKELRAMNIQIEWLVDGLIPRESVTLLYGRGGIGKTTLAMQVADAIDKGTDIYGMKTCKTQVIVVDFENSLAVLSERAKKTAVDGVLFWDSSLNPPALDKAGSEAYRELLSRYPKALFIIDTLRSAHGGDENNSETMSLIMRRMRELRDAGATVVLLHHTPKGNDRQFKGSGAIFDLCDQTLALYQTSKPGSEQEAEDDDDVQNKTYRFGTGKKTRYRPFKVFLTFDTDLEQFVSAKNPEDEALESLHAILTRISTEGRVKQGDIVTAAEADSRFTYGGEKKVRALLEKGVDRFWIIQKGLHNTSYYDPIPFGTLAPPIKGEKLPNGPCIVPSKTKEAGKPLQSTSNVVFGNFSSSRYQTENLNNDN